MIPANSKLEIKWVALPDVVFDDQEIDWDQVAFYAKQLHGNNDHMAPPILNEDHTIRDGRHRLLAHRAVGRHTVRCIIVRTAMLTILDPDCPRGTAYLLPNDGYTS